MHHPDHTKNGSGSRLTDRLWEIDGVFRRRDRVERVFNFFFEARVEDLNLNVEREDVQSLGL